jgi:hypothetical protein
VTNFIALYRGPTVTEARLVAVSSEPQIVDRFARELVSDPDETDRPEPGKPLRLVQDDEE